MAIKQTPGQDQSAQKQPELDTLISQTLVTGTEPPEPEPIQVAGGRFGGFKGTKSATEIAETVEQRKIPVSTMDEASDILNPPSTTPEPGRPSAGDPSLRNINFNRIETSDDVLSTIDIISEQNAHFVEPRRGVRTTEQSIDAAANIEIEQILGRKAGQAFNAEQVIAARTLLVESAERLQNAARIVREGNASKADLLSFRQMVAQHAAIQAQVSGMTAEAGRALNAFKVTAEGGMLKAGQVKDALESSGGVGAAEKLAAMIDDAADPAAVAKVVRKSWNAKSSDMVLEFWINGLLSSPATHVVNMTSNAMVALWQVPERLLASGISKLLRSEQGVYAGEAVSQLYGVVQGGRDGLRLAWKALKTGEPSDAAQKYEARKYRNITSENISEILGKKGRAVGLDPTAVANGGFVAQGVDLLGEAVRLPGRFLGAEDEFFKAIGYRMELNALAYRQASEEGLTGKAAAKRITEIINDPPESVHIDAMNAGRYQTFTNALGDTGQSVQRLANSHPAIKLLLPFVRTPVNIVKFVGARSPLAPFAKSFRADVAAGGARRDLALARMSMGSLVMMIGASMAADGTITGRGPENKGVRDAMRRKGWQPYSLKVGESYYSFNRTDPLGMFLGLSADVVDVIKYADEASGSEAAVAVSVALAQNLTSRTYLRGLSEFMSAMDDPGRYMDNYIKRQAATFVPYTSLVAQTERSIDPTLRMATTIMDQIYSRTPGLSGDLPPRRNLWGEPIVLEGGLGWDMISPIYTSTEKTSIADDEIIENEINIRLPRKALGSGRFAVELMPEEYSRYVYLAGKGIAIQGRGLKRHLEEKVIPSRAYKLASRGPDGGRALMIRKTISKFRDAAKVQLLKEYPGLANSLGEARIEKQRALVGDQ